MDFEAVKPHIAKLAEKYGLSLVVLFGSQATERTQHKSDIDIAVLGEQDIDRLRVGIVLEAVLERSDVEVIDMRTASPTMRYVIARDGKVLYERNAERFASWKLWAMREWRDTEHLRLFRDRTLREWAQAA